MTLTEHIPQVPYLSGPCQRFSNIGAHGLSARVNGRVRAGLGIRGLVKSFFSTKDPAPVATAELGEPSRFREGEWVRVLDADRIKAGLDSRSRLRGLEFGVQQWPTCGRSFRVAKVVRRIINDGGEYRRVSRTVLLDDVHCDAPTGGDGAHVGCGRRCPMMYRDEWLEPIADGVVPGADVPVRGGADTRVVTVRALKEIEATLDFLGRRDSLMFMPEMARFAGAQIRVTPRIKRVWELGVWIDVESDVFLAATEHCTGAILGVQGPCDRQCLLLWHRDWLQPN